MYFPKKDRSMKKFLLIVFFGLLVQSVSLAQEAGASRVHVMGQYALRFEEWGVGAGWEYFFSENFALMPHYTRIFPRVGNASNFSTDLRYYLTTGASPIYVMAGYSLSSQNNSPGTAGSKISQSGANVGVGAVIPLQDWVSLSTEFKFQSQGFRQTYFRFGLAFPIN